MLQEFNLQIELPHLLNTKLSNSQCNKLYEAFSISGILTSHTLMRRNNSLILIFTYLSLVLQRVQVLIQKNSEEKLIFCFQWVALFSESSSKLILYYFLMESCLRHVKHVLASTLVFPNCNRLLENHPFKIKHTDPFYMNTWAGKPIDKEVVQKTHHIWNW